MVQWVETPDNKANDLGSILGVYVVGRELTPESWPLTSTCMP